MRTLIALLLFSAALRADPEYPAMGPDIYDIHADGAQQIDDALVQARAGHKRVLVDFGANWCIWCRRLHATMEGDPGVAAKLRDSFVVVMIDVNRHKGPARNPALIAKYGNPVRFGIPVLIVLDSDGRLLTTEDSGNLEEGDHHSPSKILAFLNQWSFVAPGLAALDRLTAPDVPAFGPSETQVDPPDWTADPALSEAKFPGNGAAQHPMLLIGEGCNKIFIVKDGRIVWTYSTGKGWEYDDAWLLSNGNVLFSRMSYAEEVTPQKAVVWRLDSPKGTEIHTVQPIGLDRVLLVENGLPPRLLVINLRTGATEVDHVMPAPSPTDRGTVHGQFRRIRMTAQGTYLAPLLEMNKVVEFDRNFNQIWSYDIPSPWAAVRLHNGNTLITDERGALTREVSPKGETVWEYRLSEVPPGIPFHGSQSCVRLENGNTILCSRGDKGAGCQLIEVTPDKKLVWAMYDWNDFGPATAIQVLDEPGIPENPGDLQR